MLFTNWRPPSHRLAGRRFGRPQRCRPTLVTRLSLEFLEDRALPSVNPIQGFAGLAFDQSVPADLPDTILAVGPSQVVEATNRDIAFFDKAGTQLLSEHLKAFWAPVLPSNLPVPGDIITDPKVTYDELAGRFAVTTFELNFATQDSHLLLAVSNDANPLDGFTEMHRISTVENGTFGDFPQLGWDADAIYVTTNQFKFVGHNPFDHALVMTFATSSLTDGANSTLTMYSVDRLPPHFAMQPAVMHGANPGDPMYFVESMVPGGSSGGGGFIDVVQMTDKLSTAPTFTDFKVLVPHYNHPPNADQLGGGPQLDTGDGRILSAAWRNGELVATQTVQDDPSQTAQARWYQFSTAGAAPSLVQTGNIDRGAGVSTYVPSINIAPSGDLGLSFLESSANEYLSMYITGRKGSDPAGALQAPVLAKAGEATFRVFHAGGVELPGPLRTGDYCGVAMDPVDGSFWAANEYATPPLPVSPLRRANWGTFIAQFSVSDPPAPALAGSALVVNSSSSGSNTPLLVLVALAGGPGSRAQSVDSSPAGSVSMGPGSSSTTAQVGIPALAPDGTTSTLATPLATQIVDRVWIDLADDLAWALLG
jgi:hypothetical protein